MATAFVPTALALCRYRRDRFATVWVRTTQRVGGNNRFTHSAGPGLMGGELPFAWVVAAESSRENQQQVTEKRQGAAQQKRQTNNRWQGTGTGDRAQETGAGDRTSWEARQPGGRGQEQETGA